jgi:membrane protein implicated in regulation of membrane protease activity
MKNSLSLSRGTLLSWSDDARQRAAHSQPCILNAKITLRFFRLTRQLTGQTICSMQYLNNYLYWLIGGAVLILLEFLVPGLVVVFLGLGALLTGGVLYLGWISEPVALLAFFAFSSIVMLATLRRLIMRFYPSDSERVEADEDKLLIGQKATAISTIYPTDFSGRIRFSGTTWSARSERGVIPEGTAVVIVGRENIHFVVRAERID